MDFIVLEAVMTVIGSQTSQVQRLTSAYTDMMKNLSLKGTLLLP